MINPVAFVKPNDEQAQDAKYASYSVRLLNLERHAFQGIAPSDVHRVDRRLDEIERWVRELSRSHSNAVVNIQTSLDQLEARPPAKEHKQQPAPPPPPPPTPLPPPPLVPKEFTEAVGRLKILRRAVKKLTEEVVGFRVRLAAVERCARLERPPASKTKALGLDTYSEPHRVSYDLSEPYKLGTIEPDMADAGDGQRQSRRALKLPTDNA